MRVDTLHHEQRAVAQDLREEDDVHVVAQGLRREAVPKEPADASITLCWRHEWLLTTGFGIDEHDLEQVPEVAVKVARHVAHEVRPGLPRPCLNRRDVVLADPQVLGELPLRKAPLLAHRLEAGCPDLNLHGSMVSEKCIRHNIVHPSASSRVISFELFTHTRFRMARNAANCWAGCAF